MKTENFFAILLIAGLLAGCSNDDDSVEPIADPEANYFVSVDPDNNLLLKVNRDDGTVVSYYGEKNELGRAVQRTYTVVEQPGEEPVILNYGPYLALTPAASLEPQYYEWGSPMLSMKFNDRQSNLLVMSAELLTWDNGGLPVQFKGQELKGSRQMEQSSCAEDNFIVSIETCGEAPTDEILMALLLKPVDQDGIPILIGKPLGEGQFCFYVPGSPEIDLSSMCLSVEMFLRSVCQDQKPFSNFCGNLEELASFGDMAPMDDCDLVTSAINISCETLQASVATGEGSLLTSTCDARVLEEELQAFPDQFQVEPTLIFEGGKTMVLDAISITQPYDDLVINVPEEAALADITIRPPYFFDDYGINLFFECLTQPTTATLSLEGTDGFTLNEVKPVPAGNSTVEFTVPNLEPRLIFDAITIEVDGLGTYKLLVEF